MVDERTRELIHQEIDGENSSGDSRRLSELLSSDAQAKALFDEMKDLDRLLGEVPQIEPPRALHARIVNALPAAQPSVRPRRSFLSFFTSLVPEIRPAFALTLVGGIVLGLVGSLIFSHTLGTNPEILTEVVGSSVSRTAVSTLTPAQETHLGVPGAEFDLDLRTSPQAVLLKLSGTANRSLLVQIRYAANELTLDSFHKFGGQERGFVSDPEGGITLTVDGRTDLGFLFHPSMNTAHRLQVRVFDGPRLVGESTLSTRTPG